MAIIKTGKQLIKESASRWKDFVQNMSKANRKRLITEGIAKSEDAYIYGINRGTANILKRYGYTRGNIDAITPAQASKAQASVQRQYARARAQNDQIGMARNSQAIIDQKSNPEFGINAPSRDLYESAADTKGKIIHTKGMIIPRKVSTDAGKRFVEALVNRHEAYEAVATEKALQKYLKNPQKGEKRALSAYRKSHPIARALSDDKALLYGMPNLAIRAEYGAIRTPGRFKSSLWTKRGSHANIDVLGKERKIMDTFPYKDNDGYTFMRDMRSDEYKYMDRAGAYTPAQKHGPLDRFLSRLRLKKPLPETLERYNKNNFRKMTSQMRRGTPIDMGARWRVLENNYNIPMPTRLKDTWTPLY